MPKIIEECALCQGGHFDLLWDLPKLPFTEKYGSYSPQRNCPVDQTLLICLHCGHIQLGKQVDPEILYAPSEYSFRTSASKSALQGTEFFYRFFLQISGGKKFQSLVDIGGNDLYLAKKAQGVAVSRCVIDPVCQGQDGQFIDGVKVFGKFVEEIDFSINTQRPDLLFCRHVFEHIAQPKKMLQQLFEQCHSSALYFFEIPCFENLIEANRFDAIFHQHYHYFDLVSFKWLLYEAGGEYLSHTYNRQGSCGGALLIAFKKASRPTSPPKINVHERKANILYAIMLYRHQMDVLSHQLMKFSRDIYGYGASLMLATLAYHLKTDFSELICILDDDESKHELGYQNLPVNIQCTKRRSILENQNYLVTSLENTKILVRKIADLKPRRILVPSII